MVFDAGRQQLSPDRTPDTSSASLRRGCRDQDRVTSETRPRFDAQITRGGVNSRREGKKKKKLVTGRRVIASASFHSVSSRLVHRRWTSNVLGRNVARRVWGKKRKKKRKNSKRREEVSFLSSSFLFLFCESIIIERSSTRRRRVELYARVKARLQQRREEEGARRSCDVFVKRCRLGTKEARLNCAPRGSVTGGREVADKRELYKMGCTAPYEEGEGAPYGKSGRLLDVPVGHPVGASNAIFHRSRFSSKSTKRSLSRSLSRCTRKGGGGRGGGGEGGEGAHVGARVGPICQI